ncbi:MULTISPECIES: C45 family peptidase [unclassified Exiguobacterium]|uniref:C45 family autoproteolytic acyltransferase/hydolase n=2 Tax=Exiguobacterium TaxID=33986 RepID=UPI001BEBF6A5|nr:MULTISPECIES: C45 family peptidase [unclassified Exiguobacterium]MDT0173135.1 C45 family peptidase [Exiguobacterium sp. BRG2]
MQRVANEITQFRGSHYDFGREQGRYVKRNQLLHNREDNWKIRVPRFQVDPVETKEMFLRYAPHIWDELLGLQDELKLSLPDTLLHFGHYRVEGPKSGCSIMTGDNFLVRNYDYHPMTYDGRFSVFQPNDGGSAIIGPASRVTGRMDGMNEHGLAMGYNFINRRRPGDGFVSFMIGRIILEMCTSVDDAISLVKEIPHRGSFTYVVHDKSARSFVIEATARDVQVRESNLCTNHFDLLQHENRYHLDDSKRRMMELKTHQHMIQDAESAFRLLNDTDKGVFADLYAQWAGTIHTSAYFPEELKVWFALGGDQEPVTFDFADWLAGNDFTASEITGELETNIQFANTLQTWR